MIKRTVSIEKGGHSYVFRYAPGRETAMLAEIERLARDASSSLSWLEAAELGFCMASAAAGEGALAGGDATAGGSGT